MELDPQKYRGRRLVKLLPDLEDLRYKLLEVKPPGQMSGTGAARVLHIRKRDDVIEILFCLEDYL